MRLRHKKPLNPYKGQTNNDKSEFNDDDFNQQGSPIKRTATGANDQVFKYARILSKFIKTANQSYRLFAAHDDLHPGNPSHQHREQLPLNDSENQRENTPFKSQQINQRKQKLKPQLKKQVKQPKREAKVNTKKKDAPQTLFTNQENKPKPTDHSSVNSIEPSKINSVPKNNIENVEKVDKNASFVKNEAPNRPATNLSPFSPQNSTVPGQKLKNDSAVATALNQNAIQNNLHAYLNYANIFGQNQMLPGMYTGMQGLPMQMSQLPIGMMQSYMPNMQFGNIKLMGMGMNNHLLVQSQQQAKPCQNLFNQQAKLYSNKDNNKPNNSKEVYPLKRSAFHVAIAYKIYLDKLKKEGISFQNLEEIDPTKNARRIKSGQGSARGKESIKKKK